MLLLKLRLQSTSSDSRLGTQYKTNDWDSSKRTCKSVNVQITNKHSTALLGGKFKVKFKDTGKEHEASLRRQEAGKPDQFTILFDISKPSGCIVEKVTFDKLDFYIPR